MRIDAHHHLWRPARGDYHWMPMDNPILARTYTPVDYAPHLQAHGIDKTVLVQAAATVQETEYMLGLADATPWIAGVVGWVNFEDDAQIAEMMRLAAHPKFLGLRPMIQDLPDDEWMLRPDVQWAFEAMIDLDLTFDALGFPRHLPHFHTILTRYPELRTVIDHGMKPDFTDAGFGVWAEGMARLAADTNATCKFSGLITEAGPGWSVAQLQPYATHMLSIFGPSRLMWGSDWPVCRLRCEYDVWRGAADDLTRALSVEDRAQVFGGTASEFYNLSV